MRARKISPSQVRILLLFLIAASAAIRITWAISEPQIVVPDESSFSGLADHISKGGDWRTWSGGWGATFFPHSIFLVSPSAWLIEIGLEPLAATRVMSIIFGSGASSLLVCIWWLIDRCNTKEDKRVVLPALGIGLMIFLPSHMLWSTLALRDSTIEFATVLALFGVTITITGSKHLWQRILGLAIMATALTVLAPMRPGAALIVAISILLGALWPMRKRPRILIAVSVTALTFLMIGPAINANLIKTVTPSVTPTPSVILLRLYGLAAERQGRQEGANSAVSASPCNQRLPLLEQVTCEAFRFPGALQEVALRPLWPIDAIGSQSATQILAAIENSFWLLLFMMVVVLPFRRRMKIARLAIMCYSIIALHLALMAVAEGNIGSAFRHKSTVVVAIALIMILGDGISRISDYRPPSVLRWRRQHRLGCEQN